MMETRREVLVVATGATRMSEVPELRIMSLAKDRRLVVSARGRQNMKQQEYVFVFRKLLSGWNSPSLLLLPPARMLGGAAAASRASLSWQEQTAALGTGGLACPGPLE